MIGVGLKEEVVGLEAFELEEPRIKKEGEALISMISAGICATDRNMVKFNLKDFPPDENKMVLGHEGLGVVKEFADSNRLKTGDWVVPTVRRGCGDPTCLSCLNNYPDMCSTGRYTERGIHKLHGFFTEYVVEEDRNLVRVPDGLYDLAVLTEPMSIVEKAMEHVRFIQSRPPWAASYPDQAIPKEDWGYEKKAMVIGAGPIGFLATCLLRLEGVETWVLEIVDEDHMKIQLIKQLGAIHLDARELSPEKIFKETGHLDIIFEASGASEQALNLIPYMSRNSIYIFTGLPRGECRSLIDSNRLMKSIVRSNQVILGIVNANQKHFIKGLEDMKQIRTRFGPVLQQMITHRYTLNEYGEAFSVEDPNQMKVVFDINPGLASSLAAHSADARQQILPLNF